MFEVLSQEPGDSLMRNEYDRKDPFKKEVKSIIKTCFEQTEQNKHDFRDVDLKFYTNRGKKHNFDQAFEMVRDLEDNELHVINAMFHYHQMHMREDLKEADDLAAEYKNGKIDPGKINSKFQKQQEQKKKREEALKRKKDQS